MNRTLRRVGTSARYAGRRVLRPGPTDAVDGRDARLVNRRPGDASVPSGHGLTGSGRRVKRVRTPVVLGTLLAVVALTACDSGGGASRAAPRSSTTSTSRPAGDGALSLGQLAPVTGPVSTIASSFTTPVQLAVDEMNLAGGVNGKPVTVTVADDASAIPTARAALTSLV